MYSPYVEAIFILENYFITGMSAVLQSYYNKVEMPTSIKR